MVSRKRVGAVISIPVLLAVLSGPGWTAAAPGSPGHYPGRDCSECHKIRGKMTGRMPLNPGPAGASTGTGSGGSQPGGSAVNGAQKQK